MAAAQTKGHEEDNVPDAGKNNGKKRKKKKTKIEK